MKPRVSGRTTSSRAKTRRRSRSSAGSFDLLISTVNVKLDWDAMIGTLAPNGRLHVVGAVLEPIPVAAFSLILQQRSVSGSPTGSPVAIATMLDFASRHNDRAADRALPDEPYQRGLRPT